ncbi:MAG: DUF1579 domain-containing protein [Gemmataceae bacterium]|nr:DUF1579 domain-containing protein [Gemmataceae bacterium]
MRRTALAVLALSLALGLAGAHPRQDRDKKDPQSAVEPKSAPGAGQKFLERFVGEWDVVKTFHARQGEPAVTKGTCRQTMIHGGRFLQSEFTFAGPAGPTTGTGLIGYEPAADRFTSVWVDSRQTRMSFRQGAEKFDGEQIVLHAKELGGAEGRASRTVTRLEENGDKIVHRQYGAGADGKDRLVMELVLTRKPGKPKGN